MKKLNELYKKLIDDDVYFFHNSIPNNKSAVIELNSEYGIVVDYSKIDTFADELSVLAHEYGHIKTGSTHRMYSPLELISRHEYRATRYAITMLIPFAALKAALISGICEIWELAEHFEVTEDFIKSAIQTYTDMGVYPF